MHLEIAEQASQLLKKKITLEEDLQKLLSRDYIFEITTKRYNGNVWMNSDSRYALNINKNKEFINKLKFLAILEVEKEIEKITDEIKALKYS